MKKSGLIVSVVPCLLAIAPAAFAQTDATATTNTTTTPTTAPAAAPTATGTTATDAATTTTTTTTTAAPTDMTAAPATLPRTGGDPETFVLLGAALSGGMLALRRRFAR